MLWLRSKSDLEALLSVLIFLVLGASAQRPRYQAVPINCGKICFPSDGYALWFGGTLCLCRSELCRYKYCTQQERCSVKSLWYGDVAACEALPVSAPAPRPLAGINPGLSTTERCSQPPITGRCRALIKRFHFDNDIKICKEFIYGGCEANDNNFETMEDCLTMCQPTDDVLGSSSDDNSEITDLPSVSNFLYSLVANRAGNGQL